MSAPELFEDLAAKAAESYFGGEDGGNAVNFGFPRRILPAGFRGAVDLLCDRLGEGGKHRDFPRLRDQKDAKLDIVAWREFSDRRPGKLIGFGQCAAGLTDWKDKLTEMVPLTFIKKWMRDPLTVEPLRMFFIPRRIERFDWDGICMDGGILFDRCRIAGHTVRAKSGLRERCRRWSTHVITKRLGR